MKLTGLLNLWPPFDYTSLTGVVIGPPHRVERRDVFAAGAVRREVHQAGSDLQFAHQGGAARRHVFGRGDA